MPHSDHHLRSIYNALASLHEHDQLHTVTIGKNQKIQLLGDTYVSNDIEAEDIPRLKLAEAKEFEGVVQGLGLGLDDNVNQTSRQGKHYSLLHQAIIMGRMDWFNLLLDHGANPLLEDAEGNNCLMLAALENRQEMLLEFGKMVTVEEKAHKQETASAEPQKQPMLKADHAIKPAPKDAHPHKKHQKPKKTTNRVALTEADLNIVNQKSKKSVLMILAEKQLGAEKNNQALAEQQLGAESHKQAKKVVQAISVLFNELVSNMKIDSEKKVEDKVEAKKESAVTVDKSAINEAVANYQSVIDQYRPVIHQFSGFFEETRSSIKLKEATTKKQFNVLNAFIDAEKDRSENVVMPHDREVIAGVLMLIQNYSYFSFFSWKHFRADANKLVAPYVAQEGVGKKTISKVSDVVELYQYISAELSRVVSLDHSKNIKNDHYNSDYCRRLEMCKKHLEDTVIIQHYDAVKQVFNLKKYAEYLQMTDHKLKKKVPL